MGSHKIQERHQLLGYWYVLFGQGYQVSHAVLPMLLLDFVAQM
jgi:hypothetical protein